LKSQEATNLETIASLQESVADEEKALLASREDHKKTTAERDAIQKYLFKIAPGCSFITNNIDTRKSNREHETTSLQSSVDKLKSTPQYKEAKAKADKEALGQCAEKCVGAMESVACKACQDGTSESGYCAAHADAEGC